MYRNLKGEMIKLDIKAEDIAKKLNLKPETVRRKINGQIEISFKQCIDVAQLLKERSGKTYSIDYLFKSD